MQEPLPLTSEDRTWGMLAHAGAFVGLFFGIGYLGFVAPLVVLLLKREESEFAADQAKEALNFQILLLGINLMMGVFLILTLGLGVCLVVPAAIILLGIELILTLVASLKAKQGQRYRYPNPLRIL